MDVSLNPTTTPTQRKARERAGSSHQGGSYDLAARFGIVLMCAWTQLSADSFSGFAMRGSRLSWLSASACRCLVEPENWATNPRGRWTKCWERGTVGAEDGWAGPSYAELL